MAEKAHTNNSYGQRRALDIAADREKYAAQKKLPNLTGKVAKAVSKSKQNKG